MKRKIRVGILGLGRAGRYMHAPELALSPDCFEIVAGCDRAADRRRDLPPQFTGATIYASLDEMLTDTRVEMVTVATRNPDHTPHALQALAAGKYVVMDKPVAVTLEQAGQLEKAAAVYPGKLFFRQNRRFEPAFCKVRKIMDSGMLGHIGMVKIYRHPGFVRRCDWQTLTEYNGGMFNNWGPHLVDQALQLLEAPVDDLWCDLQHNVTAGDADDQVKLLLRGVNGRVVDVEISTTATLPGRLYEVWGNRGSLFVPVEEKTVRLRYLDPKQQLKPLRAVRENFPLAYGNPNEKLRFIDEELPIDNGSTRILQRGRVLKADEAVDPERGYTYPDTMWGHIYAAVVEGVPYPVTVSQGLEVVRITERARQAAKYRPLASRLSGCLSFQKEFCK
ncbi:MAG: Gfo/Idh/MocA family oxidoreductase [Victivallales bacterium]|nr:Gfo/Idh/MocA family oxidoreductase [Victivallales bacterium]